MSASLSTDGLFRALVFDFDGLIIDTEEAVYRSWQELYQRYGEDLPFEPWAAAIGTLDDFDPLGLLEEMLGRPIDGASLREEQSRREAELSGLLIPRPGVVDYLDSAQKMGLALAIASSGNIEWVVAHLERLGLEGYWSAICCADGDRVRAKPSPPLYLEALDHLRVPASRAVAFEDSPNGILAARRAGVACVAVPNALTARLDLRGADLVMSSLAELPLSDLLARLRGG